MKNRKWMFGGGAAVLVGALLVGGGLFGADDPSRDTPAVFARAASAEDAPLVTLYKNPTCACCADWADHMRENGFEVDVKDGADLAKVKEQHGVPLSASSCHTAVVDGYALEGHVPADVVHRLLAERPEVAGLAVPGMPLGVPGMPGEGLKSFDILSFRADGGTQVYATS